jgi:hypothetical protein
VTVRPALNATFPTVKQTLITLLEAEPALAGVLVTWSSPTGSAPDEFIMLGDGTFTVTSAAIGSQRREERGTIEIVISVIQTTGDQSLPTLRAFVLRDTVAAVLRRDATLGNGGNAPRWALDAGYQVAERSNGTKSETQIIMTIETAARI